MIKEFLSWGDEGEARLYNHSPKGTTDLSPRSRNQQIITLATTAYQPGKTFSEVCTNWIINHLMPYRFLHWICQPRLWRHVMLTWRCTTTLERIGLVWKRRKMDCTQPQAIQKLALIILSGIELVLVCEAAWTFESSSLKIRIPYSVQKCFSERHRWAHSSFLSFSAEEGKCHLK